MSEEERLEVELTYIYYRDVEYKQDYREYDRVKQKLDKLKES